jgi:hypothetical protein
MKFALVIAAALGLSGCYSLSDQQGQILTAAVQIGVNDLCIYAQGQYSKLGNPTAVQKIAKAQLDAACADPATTSAILVNTYNQFAKVTGSKTVQGN